jgi:hypothetical protein
MVESETEIIPTYTQQFKSYHDQINSVPSLCVKNQNGEATVILRNFILC